jgi:hypothetical protein
MAQQRVHRRHQVRLLLALAEDRPELAGMRERPDQHVRLPAPRGTRKLQPVPLDLLPLRLGALDRRPTLVPSAGLAARPETTPAKLAHEGDVAAPVAERDHLLVQRRAPQVRVLQHPLAHVRDEGGEHVGTARAAHAGHLPAPQVGADRLAVAAEVAGDRTDRPAPAVKRFFADPLKVLG